MAAIKVIKDRCPPIISTQKDLLGSLPEDVKRLKEDAITYEKLGNYKKAIEILEGYIKKLKEIGEDKNKDLINEAYVKINEDYKNIIRNDIKENKKESYLDAWSIFNKEGNKNFKDSIKDDYRKVVLTLAEPINCESRSLDECTIYDKTISLSLKEGLGNIDWQLSKGDISEFKKLGCFKKGSYFLISWSSKCLNCETEHILDCGDYSTSMSSAQWSIPYLRSTLKDTCNNDPCNVGKCVFSESTFSFDCSKI